MNLNVLWLRSEDSVKEEGIDQIMIFLKVIMTFEKWGGKGKSKRKEVMEGMEKVTRVSHLLLFLILMTRLRP